MPPNRGRGGRGAGAGAGGSSQAQAQAQAQAQPPQQSQQHLAAVREQWEAVQAMVAESERTAALLQERLQNEGPAAGGKRVFEEEVVKEGGGTAGATSSPTRRKRQRPVEGVVASSSSLPWRRFLPPHGPVVMGDWTGQHPDDALLAALAEGVRRLRTGPGALGPHAPAAVGRAMEVLVGRWARGRWGQELLPSLARVRDGGERRKQQLQPAALVSAAATEVAAVPNEAPPQQQQEHRPRAWRDAEAVLCPFDLHGTCNDPECPHLHLASAASSSSPPTTGAADDRQPHQEEESAAGAASARAWRPIAEPLPPFRHPWLLGADASSMPSAGEPAADSGGGRAAAAPMEDEGGDHEEEDHEVAVLLGASTIASAAASPSAACAAPGGRQSFAEQADFVPLALLADDDDDGGGGGGGGGGDDDDDDEEEEEEEEEGEEEEEEEGAGAEGEEEEAMDESSNGGGGSGLAGWGDGRWDVEETRDFDAEMDRWFSSGIARYFYAQEAAPKTGTPVPILPGSDLEEGVASHPGRETWLALATRKLLVGTMDGPEQEEDGWEKDAEVAAVEAALRTLGAATEMEALAAWLLRLEEGGGAQPALSLSGEALRPALRVLARALDDLAPGSEHAQAPWLLYLRLYVALPTGGPPACPRAAGLVEEAQPPPTATPAGALSPSLAGKADALVEAACEHNPGDLLMWRAAEAYHRLCRVPAEAPAAAAAAAAAAEGAHDGTALARALRLHDDGLAALQQRQGTYPASCMLLLLQRARCLLWAGHGAEAVRTLAVPLGALVGQPGLAAALLSNNASSEPALPTLPPEIDWQRVFMDLRGFRDETSAYTLWAALLHLTAFGCLPPPILDVITFLIDGWPFIAWHPADAAALAGKAAVQAVAAAYRSWREGRKEEWIEVMVMEWNLTVLALSSSPAINKQTTAAGVPRWLVWGMGRLSTLRPALRLAAAVLEGDGRWLWRQMMENDRGLGPFEDVWAARIGLLVACLAPKGAAEAMVVAPPGKGPRWQEDEERQQLIKVRDFIAREVGLDGGAKGGTLPAQSLEEEAVALGEALLKDVLRDQGLIAPGATVLTALLLARLRLRCGGADGLGAAVAGLRQYLLTTAAAKATDPLERAALWLELLELMEQRRQQQEAAAVGARKGKGGAAGKGGGGASSSVQQQMESALAAAIRDLTMAQAKPAEPLTSYNQAVKWALDERPRCRRLGALAVEALVQGLLGLPRWGDGITTPTPVVPDPLSLLLPAAPLPLPSGALVVLSQAALAHALGRPSRAGTLFRLRAALRARVMRRLVDGWRARDRGGGGAFVDEDEEGGMEAVCLAQVEMALQELGPAQLALERGLLLDPLAAAGWAALLQLEACFGGSGGGGNKEDGGRARLPSLGMGLRVAGVNVPLQLSLD